MVAALSGVVACHPTRPPVAPIALTYHVAPEIRSCPNVDALTKAVNDLLGYAPWTARARRRVFARVETTDGGLRAFVQLQAGGGPPQGSRTLVAETTECRELGEALALAIALAIDPLATPSAANPRPQRPSPPSARLRFGAGAHVAAAAAPSLTGGGHLELGWAWRSLYLAAAARLDAPAEVATGELAAHLLGGSILACGQYDPWFACSLLAVSALRAEGRNISQARTAWLPIVAPGVRAGGRLSLTGPWSLALYLELLIPVVGARLTDRDDRVEFWRTPPASGSLAIDLQRDF